MKCVVFSGTSEGKEICAFLNEKKLETIACVATEYGKKIMDEGGYIKIHSGRMEEKEMADFISGCDFVIDATHPYAKIVTENIKMACKAKKIEYIRLLRDEELVADGNYIADIQKAVEMLKDFKGNIFVSTGSKEIEAFTKLNDYENKVFARVLDTAEVREKCEKLGFKNVLYKKGPFSYEDNLKDFKWAEAKALVTKSSGKAGGFEEKIKAAKSLDMQIIIIKRPEEDTGYSIEEVKKKIEDKLNEK